MDPFSFSVGADFVVITFIVLRAGAEAIVRGIRLYRLYGPHGLILFLFGNRTTWRLEAEVLGRVKDEDAMAFKAFVQEQCNMISIAAAIVAQIAITALSLTDLGKVHWIARGFLSYSLISALMAVYYATTQHRVLGWLLRATQIRFWIRGGGTTVGNNRALHPPDGGDLAEQRRAQSSWLNNFVNNYVNNHPYLRPLKAIFPSLVPNSNLQGPCDPQVFITQVTPELDAHAYLRKSCFTPSVSAVITMSAPQALLSSSLFALLIALGVYFGFVWTRNIDLEAGVHDSRNVFIMYITSLGVCLVVYTLSRIIQDDDNRSETVILDEYIMEYMQDPDNIETVNRWRAVV